MNARLCEPCACGVNQWAKIRPESGDQPNVRGLECIDCGARLLIQILAIEPQAEWGMFAEELAGGES